MSGDTVYDRHVADYLDFVDRVLAAEPSLFGRMLDVFGELLDGRLDGATVLDVACGEGYLSRYLASRGPREIVGIDLSSELVDAGRGRTDAPNVTLGVDDARELASVGDATCDVVVSQMAMMDIADHRAAFAAVRRVLVANGTFCFSLLHPCFETPHLLPDEPQFLTDEDGNATACVVRRYSTEGHWFSGGDGIRGKMGSNHRTLSTYVNDLIGTGFVLERIVEPVFEGTGLWAEVPRVMFVCARHAGVDTDDAMRRM